MACIETPLGIISRILKLFTPTLSPLPMPRPGNFKVVALDNPGRLGYYYVSSYKTNV